ncbi:HlyD family secretion protein [Pirellulimonas nuda]|uniref:HlyD family secretion protein n=1 Tax=Pirellulimonas nuda TaxID=2528009 RepID=A0A518DAK3_9BACT|nr:efflux RND transporter periplasmic adaptor subunit [Pirellulimonas nuda]QDU88483.1 HlyD family secretion protein [Pirellulimonas nuda]
MDAARPRSPEGSQLFDVDSFLDDLGALAQAEQSHERFYGQLLESSRLALGAEAAGFWQAARGRTPSLRHGRRQVGAAATDPVLAKRLKQAARSGVPQRLTGSGRVGRGWVLACPVRSASGPVGVLTHHLPEEMTEQTADRLLELAAAIAEIADDFELRRQVAATGDTLRRLARVESLLLRLHRAWKLPEVARLVCDQGRRVVGCDRLALLEAQGSRWRLIAISGVETPARRSDAVRKLERLTRVVAMDGQLLVAGENPTEAAPQVERALEAYLGDSECRCLVVSPGAVPEDEDAEQCSGRLQRRRPVVALVAEHYAGKLPENALPALETLTAHAAIAVERVQTVGAAPLLGWLTRLGAGRSLRALALAGLAAALAAAAAASLVLVPAELKIAAEGRLEPVDSSRVFAPCDATVDRLLVRHGQRVKVGEPLLLLRSSELQLDIEQAEAELATAKQEVAALETAKLRAGIPSRDRSPETDVSALAARIAALNQSVEAKTRRVQLLQEESQRLRVVSPTAGVVTSWKPADYLAGRPVRRGQRLLEVAASDGQWRIELETPDRDAGHLLRAVESGPVSASFVVKSDPATTYRGRVLQVASATQQNESGEPVLRVVVAPEEAKDLAPRSGMVVAAKLDCGQAPLGYVWFHEAWEALQRVWF